MNFSYPFKNLAKKVAAVFSVAVLLCCQTAYAEVTPEETTRIEDGHINLDAADAPTDQITNYVLAPGDWVFITDVNDPSVDGQTIPVTQDGTITLYPVGMIRAQGLTTLELAQTINEKAKELVAQAHYQVNIAQVRPIQVYVLGEVAAPGRYMLSSGDDAIIPNVLTAIQAGGGLRETANVRRVQVRRGTDVINVDLWKMASEGDSSQVVTLRPGDVVFASRGGTEFNPDGLGELSSIRGRWVRVLGAVRAPGVIELQPSDTLFSVLARTGGFSAGAATRSILLSRMNRDGTVFTKRISLSRGLKDRDSLANCPVQTGDIIVASTSLIKTVGSEVARAGMITALAMLVIYFSNKVHNVNVVTDEAGPSTDASTPATTTTTP